MSAAQRRARPEQVRLADHLVERAGRIRAASGACADSRSRTRRRTGRRAAPMAGLRAGTPRRLPAGAA